MSDWGLKDAERQDGKIVVCTGANSGLGWWFTKYMVIKGATVIAACRSTEKGEKAKAEILADLKDQKDAGSIDVMELDLANLASVSEFADKVKAKYDHVDILCNNAGIMAVPKGKTKDGFELQFGSNHLGHFALTQLLLPLLAKGTGARIINVSSVYHKNTDKIDFDDLHGDKAYDPWRAYAQSKLSNVLFTRELNKKLQESKVPVTAISAHPGFSPTNLQDTPGIPWIVRTLMPLVTPLISHPASEGALAQFRAAVDPDAKPDDYYGPKKEYYGSPIKAETSAAAKDDSAAKKLWEVSEELTKVKYPF